MAEFISFTMFATVLAFPLVASPALVLSATVALPEVAPIVMLLVMALLLAELMVRLFLVLELSTFMEPGSVWASWLGSMVMSPFTLPLMFCVKVMRLAAFCKPKLDSSILITLLTSMALPVRALPALVLPNTEALPLVAFWPRELLSDALLVLSKLVLLLAFELVVLLELGPVSLMLLGDVVVWATEGSALEAEVVTLAWVLASGSVGDEVITGTYWPLGAS